MANFPTSLPSATPADHGEVVGELRAMASALLGLPGRNRIINGSFRTNQRAYASAGALGAGAYGFDRWKSTTASSSTTFTAAPQGQLVTINSGGSFAQIVERAFVEAETYTLTWSGTATGRAYNVGGSVPSYAASPVTVAVDGLADLTVEFTASGGTRTLGTVQLEVDGPTPFERVHPGLELAMCQRYFTRIGNFDSGGANAALGVGYNTSTTNATVHVFLPVAMRASPTLSGVSASEVSDGVTAPAATGVAIAAGSTSSRLAVMNVSVASGLTANRPVRWELISTGGADFSAEL